MAAKESWLGGDVDGARAILSRAFEANPDSEGIWLAATKLEAENGQIEAAKQLMQRAREVSGTERVRLAIFLLICPPHLSLPDEITDLECPSMHAQIWVKSAVFERTHSTPDAALEMVKSGLKIFPACAKLHMMHAQLLQAQPYPSLPATREALTTGMRRCPTAVPLWIMAARLEEAAGVRIKARALLEKARNINPKSEELWLESVKVEERDGSGAAKTMLARGAFFLLLLSPSLSLSLSSFLSSRRDSPFSNLFFPLSPLPSLVPLLTQRSLPLRHPNPPNLRPPLLLLRLDRAPPNPQNPLRRRPQKDQQQPRRYRYGRAALLGRAQDREGEGLVWEGDDGGRGLRRRVGVVVEV